MSTLKTLNKEMLAEKQKLKIKMAEMHKCTIETFRRVNQIIESSNNSIEITNSLNLLSNSTYVASMFHISIEKELEKKDKTLKIELKNLREEQKKSFDNEKYFLNDKKLANYINYYDDVLNGEPKSSNIPLVETSLPKNAEFDKKSINNFMNNFARNSRDNEVIFKKIDEDPAKTDYYAEKSKFCEIRKNKKMENKLNEGYKSTRVSTI